MEWNFRNKDKTSKYMSEEYFNDVNDYVSSFIQMADKLDKDKVFVDSCNNMEGISINSSDGKFGNAGLSTVKGKLLVLMIIDIVRSFEHSGHPLNFDEQEQFGVFLFLLRMYESEIKYEELSIYYERSKTAGEDLVRQMMATPEPEGIFFIPTLLKDYSSELLQKYYIMLYRIVSLTSKCDGIVTEKESNWMKEIMKLSEQSVAASTATADTHVAATTDSHATATVSSFTQLDELIGLSSVKQEVKALVNLIRIQQKREENGLKITSPTYHCVFTGNPGTGKTTVARILAGIYKELGILKKGQLVETDRSGLVAEYVGQTAVKTNKIIDNALDGVLFIDEAYSLVSGDATDFGGEAIATLLKRMEDDRARLVVILAGYTNEMKDFIDSNPGLQSRFNRYINFPDYSADELLQIFDNSLKKYEYVLADAGREKLALLFSNAVANKDVNFGNGRYVRNIFDKTIQRQANRLAEIGNVTVALLSEITVDDIPSE
jgi:SpoVK/Ycf46/Vps4 family AAA+-type ATPase